MRKRWQTWTGQLQGDRWRSYNITRAMDACFRSEFGPPVAVEINAALLKHISLRHLYPEVLMALPLQPAHLDLPCLHFVEGGREYVADGVHRITVRHRLGIGWYPAFLLPEGAHDRFEIPLQEVPE